MQVTRQAVALLHNGNLLLALIQAGGLDRQAGALRKSHQQPFFCLGETMRLQVIGTEHAENFPSHADGNLHERAQVFLLDDERSHASIQFSVLNDGRFPTQSHLASHSLPGCKGHALHGPGFKSISCPGG
jgi:hypothetical protein